MQNMTPLFKKLNYKDQDSILILNSPEEFQPHKQAMEDFTKIQIRVSVKEIHYVLLFAVSVEIRDGMK